MTIQFKKWICYVETGMYHDKSKAIKLVNATTGELIAIATVCISETQQPPANGNIYVKGYSENEGMEDALIAAGIIKPKRIRTLQAGFVNVGEYALTEEGLKLF